jgi:hypothetical protein
MQRRSSAGVKLYVYVPTNSRENVAFLVNYPDRSSNSQFRNIDCDDVSPQNVESKDSVPTEMVL